MLIWFRVNNIQFYLGYIFFIRQDLIRFVSGDYWFLIRELCTNRTRASDVWRLPEVNLNFFCINSNPFSLFHFLRKSSFQYVQLIFFIKGLEPSKFYQGQGNWILTSTKQVLRQHYASTTSKFSAISNGINLLNHFPGF